MTPGDFIPPALFLLTAGIISYAMWRDTQNH